MAGKLDWHGPQVQAAIQAELGRRLARCAILVCNRAKELLSTDGTAKGGGRDGKGRFKKSLRYNANPSAPGEPPHVQTGRLRGSVAWEVDGLEARVGTNVPYGRWLELGTTKIAARPWLRRALSECRAQVLEVLGRPLRGFK